MPEPGEKLDEALARADVEGRVRAEYAEAASTLLDGERDKRIVALAITVVVVATVVVPFVALMLGLSWRILMWAAGTGG